MKMNQSQKNGNNSTNIQAEKIEINHGISYTEAKEIALDVFNANYLKLSEEASKIAYERSTEITEKFLAELEKRNPNGIENAKDPDFQYALFNLQKEYARSGNKDLGDLLVDLLVDRTKQPDRSILQIVLNESITIAPKLTTDQIAALSICFLSRYTSNNGVLSFDTLFNYFDTHYMPIFSLLTKNSSCYQHLEYTGCATIGIGELQFVDALKANYRGLFSKGFTKNDIQSIGLDYNQISQFFITCLHDNQKLQINAINEDLIREKMSQNHFSSDQISQLISFENNYLLSNEEIENFIIANRPYMKILIDLWKESMLKNMTLTSVGIAIGHANVKNIIGDFSDLSIWIN